MSQHLKLRDVLIDVSTSHLEFLKFILGFLLLGVVHEGSLEVFFKYYLRRSPIKFFWVILYPI
jgi:hypothetical protein